MTKELNRMICMLKENTIKKGMERERMDLLVSLLFSRELLMTLMSGFRRRW